VLDFACATGLYALEIADYVKKIDGFDISAKMISVARKNANSQNIENVDFVQTDIHDNRYEARSYDVILAFNIFHLVEDIELNLQRIAELLKPGGLLISSTPCLAERKTFISFLSSHSIYLLSRIGLLPSMKFYTIQELIELIKDGKFQMAEFEVLSKSPATECYMVAWKKH
jgi:2-polyprenyl-3-methyl-5-hydroxy-6-metoxy-1,4-benzoquinol methylase